MVREVVVIINKHDSLAEERAQIITALMETDSIGEIRVIQVESPYFDTLANAIAEEFSE
jgi:hypothetical protein